VAEALPEDCVAVVNVDDPLVAWAFEAAPRTVGVSGGLYWTQDAELCPACGAGHVFGPDGWSCPGCGRHRPAPDWDVALEGDGFVVTHGDRRIPVTVSVPGRTGPVGAAFALAAAEVMGVDPEVAAEHIRTVVDVDGRYAPYSTGTHTARLLMLKNPAGWAEAIDVAVSSGLELVVAVDPFGPKDTTTMWEAPFDRLAGREVGVTGGRTADVLAILDEAGVAAVPAGDVLDAIRGRRPGEVVVACNYPAFRRLSKQFRGAPE
jgi:UDP-N-acetylmuramyl tripeptide synthase